MLPKRFLQKKILDEHIIKSLTKPLKNSVIINRNELIQNAIIRNQASIINRLINTGNIRNILIRDRLKMKHCYHGLLTS